MSLTLDQVYSEAMLLPDASKALLAERLVEYLETHIDPGLERQHMKIVRKRRDDIRSGRVKPIDGTEALAHVRDLIKQ